MATTRVFDARIKTPAGIIVAGPPLSGKTTFTLNLLRHEKKLIDKPFDYIVWFFGEYNKTIEYLEKYGDQRIKVVQGLPENIDDYIKTDLNGCHIYDDLMQQATASKQITELTTRKCQHNRITWILIMQNLFYHGSERLTLLRSCHYLVLYKNPLDKTVASYLASRIMPKQQKTFLDIYAQATDRPNGYLFIDGAQSTPDYARLRTDIFDEFQRVFVPQSPHGKSGIKSKNGK